MFKEKGDIMVRPLKRNKLYDVVVAPSTASTKVKRTADFVCDGLSDQDTINEAMTSVLEEGYDNMNTYPTVDLLQGIYQIDGPIRPCCDMNMVSSFGCTIYLQENDTADFPSEDWHMIEGRMERTGWNYHYFHDFWLYGYTFDDWDHPASFKAPIKIPAKNAFTAHKIDIGSPLSAFNIDPAIPADEIFISLTDCFVWGEGAGSPVTAIDYSALQNRQALGLKNTSIKGCTNAISLGNKNHLVELLGYIETGSANPILGTSTGIKNYSTTMLRRNGTATVANGQTNVTVTHGRAKTPTIDEIIINPTNSKAADGWWISDIGSTTFKINVPTDPGATTATFSWTIL